jgi:ribosomal protein L10
LQVATVQKFRKGLPEGASAFVCKNNLMKVAISQTEGWTGLADKGCTVRITASADGDPGRPLWWCMQ